MKKKAIEKIPYLTLKGTVNDKKVKFVGVTALREIGGEEHLFLEVYENKKSTRHIPKVRIVLTQKDFGNFFPKTGTWSEQNVATNAYNKPSPVWEEKQIWDEREQAERSVLESEEDKQRIAMFVGPSRDWERTWWSRIAEQERNIAGKWQEKARKRKYERRRLALEDRMAHVKDLPEENVIRAAEPYLGKKHFIFYRRNGSWVTMACTACGALTERKWRHTDSYEDQFNQVAEKPQAGKIGICPACKKSGVYKCQGRSKSWFSETLFMHLGQKYKNGIVVRHIEVTKTWRMEELAGETRSELIGASENMKVLECSRTYIEPGETPKTDYNVWSCAGREHVWQDSRMDACYSPEMANGIIVPETYEAMKGTEFQYCAMEEYARKERYISPVRYMMEYRNTPQLEMLVKLGLITVAREVLNGFYRGNRDAKRLSDFFGIWKNREKQLIRDKKPDLIETMVLERKMNQHWTDEQLKHVKDAGLTEHQLREFLPYVSLQKILNHIEDYAKKENGIDCSYGSLKVELLRRTASTYLDYLHMRLRLGYDLNNTVYQHPRDLRAAHDQMAAEQNERKKELRLIEVREKFPDIKKNYAKIKKEYARIADGLLIRPAKSAEEIVMEGRSLHHCVGGDNYLSKHNRGISYILLLRNVKKPEEPYITVEIQPGGHHTILQWYGANDKKPDAERVQKWLNDYTRQLNRKAKSMKLKEAV